MRIIKTVIIIRFDIPYLNYTIGLMAYNNIVYIKNFLQTY